MLHQDSIVIDAPSDRVWEYVGSPDLWSLFHAKVESSELTSSQSGRIGSVYTIVFCMGSQTMPMRCEIIDIRPGAMIQVLSTGSDSIAAELTYSLQDVEGGTRIDERVNVIAPKLNIFIRAIFWLIERFGSPVGETTLMKLKKLVEEE